MHLALVAVLRMLRAFEGDGDVGWAHVWAGECEAAFVQGGGGRSAEDPGTRLCRRWARPAVNPCASEREGK